MFLIQFSFQNSFTFTEKLQRSYQMLSCNILYLECVVGVFEKLIAP